MRWVALWLWGLALLPHAASAQDVVFGKNKVNYSNYEWEYIVSEHFDIYFPHGSYRLAEFTAKEGERALARIQKDLKYTLHSRVPIIIYNSHNGFSETNISYEELPEGVGGFTEFAQNRVVIPYEGSYDQFRHVIHHELVHAVTFEQLTGGGGLSSLLAQTSSLPPLWVAEGMAEYLSLGWDKGADNMMRDATITGYVPSIDQIWGGLFAYKGGQSIFLMIEEKYGKDKVAEFESALRTSKTPDKALQASLGISQEKLSEEWQLWLKRRYWNDINLRKTPEETAKKLTDRKNDQSFFNLAPAFSPQGDKIAFLTDRRTYVDIYLMSAIDGKVLGRLVSGEKSAKFETMFLLRPGISWSPDGKEIAFIAKAGDRNALYTLNVKKKSLTRKLKFDLDGMFKPSWSPDGKQIAAVGLKDGMSDLYVINLNNNAIQRITTDPYEETDPSWSPDGKWIAFSSDRPQDSPSFTGDRDFPFGQYDVFVMRPDGSEMRRITNDKAEDVRPTWSPDGKRMAFISDRSGVGNIYVAELDSLVEQPAVYYPTRDSALLASRPKTIRLPLAYPVTNLLASAQDLHWSPDGKKIAFSAFHKAGYDIYVLKAPLTHKMKDADIPPTIFASRLMQEPRADSTFAKAPKDSLRIAVRPDSASQAAFQRSGDLVVDKSKQDSSWAKRAEEWVVEQGALASAETKGTKADTSAARAKQEAPQDISRVGLPEKEFEIHKYKLKFKPELFAANAGFDTFYGVSGLAQLSITDVLGNHQAMVATSLNFSLKDSDFFASYAYLKRRTHYAGMLYHTRYFFLTNSQLAADRLYGLDLQLERPFNKFNRFEISARLLNISREIIDNRYQSPSVRGGFFAGTTRGLSGESLPTRRAYTTSLALVNDNTLAGYFGPVDGSRSRLSMERSWQGLTYNTVELDTRHYFRVLKDYTFAFRLAGGASYGKNRQVFFLGGVNNEINPRFATNSRLNDLNSDEVFFSKFVWPLRGLDLFEQSGDTYLLSNIEFRFPIVRELALGWPLPFLFQNVEGDLFLDIGGAFDRGHFDPWDTRDGGLILNGFDPRKRGGFAAGYGLGIRVNVGIFLFRYDLAWPTDLSRTYSPKQYFSADIQGLF
ncbi:MAG: hypothetical protein EXS64_12295 [Candidatus Latescibacteria bacterium]|nr:hypothetical protein [Candidatus Latescibacterota bacterium]